MIFKLSNICKKYGNVTALKNISLDIRANEKVAFIGSSGAGKSTLIHLLSGFENPSNGEIFILNEKISKLKEKGALSKTIGIIRQSLDLIDSLPVIHNILIGRFNEWSTLKALWSLIIPQDEALALGALTMVGLDDKAYEITKNLSGGEKQRVAIARLILQKPHVILADEPVAALDPALSKAILELLIKLTQKNHQSLIVSLHQIDLALKYFDRIIGLKDGQVIFDKSVEKINQNDLNILYALEDSNEQMG